MPTSQNHRDLFRHPSTIDKLNFFQSLLDSKELISDLALAFILIIRAELEQPEKQSPSAYRRYSEVITCLCAKMPDVYEQVVDAWQQRHPVLLARPLGSPKEEPKPSEASEEKPQPVSAE